MASLLIGLDSLANCKHSGSVFLIGNLTVLQALSVPACYCGSGTLAQAEPDLLRQAKTLTQLIAGPLITSPFQGRSLVQILMYASTSGLLLFGVRLFFGYRRRFQSLSQQAAEAERLRDEIVFGDDAKELGVPDDPNPFNSADQDKAGKP